MRLSSVTKVGVYSILNKLRRDEKLSVSFLTSPEPSFYQIGDDRLWVRLWSVSPIWVSYVVYNVFLRNISIGMGFKMRFEGNEAPDEEMCELCIVVYHLQLDYVWTYDIFDL
jgi:hypothetical protein